MKKFLLYFWFAVIIFLLTSFYFIVVRPYGFLNIKPVDKSVLKPEIEIFEKLPENEVLKQIIIDSNMINVITYDTALGEYLSKDYYKMEKYPIEP